MNNFTDLSTTNLSVLQPDLSLAQSSNRMGSSSASSSSVLNKDDFLKILITQLTHQDPTKPMEDREFVAQMAQFSSLEQMTNMNSEMTRMAGIISRGQALQLIGKTVEINSGNEFITGVVERIDCVEVPQLLVNNRYYDFNDVQAVIQPVEKTVGITNNQGGKGV